MSELPFSVTGPGVDRGGIPSGGAALSAALTHALRPGPEASFYVRDRAGDCFGRVDRLLEGRVEVWRFDRGSGARSQEGVRPGSSAGMVLTDVSKNGGGMAETTTRRRQGRTAAASTRRPARRVSAKDAAAAVLRAEGGPLKAAEIAKRVVATKGVKLGGKTPEATVAALLSVENKKPDGLFVRVSPGTYDLREKETADA